MVTPCTGEETDHFMGPKGQGNPFCERVKGENGGQHKPCDRSRKEGAEKDGLSRGFCWARPVDKILSLKPQQKRQE